MLKKYTQISKILNSAVTGVDFPLVLKMYMKTEDNIEIDDKDKN